MTVFLTQSKDALVCVGFKHHFDVIHHTGETKRLHSVDTLKVYMYGQKDEKKYFLWHVKCNNSSQ